MTTIDPIASLSPYIKILSSQDPIKTTLELKDQTLIPYILDTLSRKKHLPIFLAGTHSELFNDAFLETIALQLSLEPTRPSLKSSYFIYLDINGLLSSTHPTPEIAASLHAFFKKTETDYARCILAINNITSLLNLECPLGKTLRTLLSHEQWRLIVCSNKAKEKSALEQSHFNHTFTLLKLSEPTNADCIAVLKTFRNELEQFHECILPDESFLFALSLAKHYLPGHPSSLDKTLQLLDSACAHIPEQAEQINGKRILTQAILIQVISTWTQIPTSHLQLGKFNTATFIQNMQKHIFGQESAIHFIGSVLQYARLKLQNKSGPLCSFLFAGPAYVGKSETAYALAEHLYGHKSALLRIVMDKTRHPKSLADIRIMTPSQEHTSISLFEAIQQRPYAVILLENINQAPAGTIDLFHDILIYGYASDHHGNKYDFRHAIIIMTTTLGSERIISLNQSQPSQHTTETADLMQLILNTAPTQNTTTPPFLSPQELGEEMRPALETYFSSKLLHYFNIVPFGLLDYAGTEKIIRMKLKILMVQLETQFNIELHYAPEVIRFLTQECLFRGTTTRPIDQILNHTLYSCVAHELISHPEDKSRSKQLSLQLNDDGKILRCEFTHTSDANLYSL